MLSGKNRYVPEALRQVLPALDALRAAPMPAELLGEAAARAYFRKIMLGGESGPARPDAGAGEARTLILPTGTPGGESYVARRPHRHRCPPQRGRRQARALAGVAAAAVVTVGAIALAGTFSNSGGHPVVVGRSRRAAGVTNAATVPGRNRVEGNGTPTAEQSVKPATKTSQPSGSTPSPSELCSEYFGFYSRLGERASPATRNEISQQLRSLAGGPGGVGYYCMRALQLWVVPPGPGNVPGMPGSQVPGGPPGPSGAQGPHSPQGHQGAGLSRGTDGRGNGGNGNGGNSENGNGGNGNGHGTNGPGSGGN